MNAQSALYNAIKADSGVLALVSSSGGNPCIGVGRIEPSTWGPELTTCLIYQLSPVDMTDEVMIADHVVNCRAPSEKEAYALASAVNSALNREEISGGGRFYCIIGAPLDPADDTDNYNVPITVRCKAYFDID